MLQASVEIMLYYFNIVFKRMRNFKHTMKFLLLLLLLAASTASAQFSADDVRQDLRYARLAIERTHPDLRHSSDPAALERAFAAVEESLSQQQPMLTRDQAWQRLATLNPLFADAHAFIGFADWRAESTAHLKADGRFFPFEVHIDDANRVFIRAELGGGKTRLAGARIVSINGVDTAELLPPMLARVHGDTPAFARKLLAQRWWLFHWKLHGAAARYALILEQEQEQEQERQQGHKRHGGAFAGASATPLAVAAEASFERQFRFELKPNDTAVLTVASFSSEHKPAFLAFTQDAFARMKQAGSKTLIIDISANGGGDDDMWLEGLIPYIAGQPYRTGSTYRKKVLETSAAKGEVAGQVVHGEIATWHQPQPNNPLRFGGKVYVPATYSSAVLFANTVQDFGMATLAGSGSAARSAQSGGVRKFVLPNTGLALWTPRFILDPPAGVRGDGLLRPDIVLPRNPYREDAQVAALLAGLK
jgi:hypothetical protein